LKTAEKNANFETLTAAGAVKNVARRARAWIETTSQSY